MDVGVKARLSSARGSIIHPLDLECLVQETQKRQGRTEYRGQTNLKGSHQEGTLFVIHHQLYTVSPVA